MSFINLPSTTPNFDSLDWQNSIINRTEVTDPGSPIVGDRYIIAGIGGNWSTFAINDIVEYTAGGWENLTPNEGFACWDETANVIVVFNGSTWGALASGISGPGSSTDTAIALWNGTGGTVLQDSLVLVDGSGNMDTPGTIKTNTIDEHTGSTGVTIEDVLIKAGDISAIKSLTPLTTEIYSIGETTTPLRFFQVHVGSSRLGGGGIKIFNSTDSQTATISFNGNSSLYVGSGVGTVKVPGLQCSGSINLLSRIFNSRGVTNTQDLVHHQYGSTGAPSAFDDIATFEASIYATADGNNAGEFLFYSEGLAAAYVGRSLYSLIESDASDNATSELLGHNIVMDDTAASAAQKYGILLEGGWDKHLSAKEDLIIEPYDNGASPGHDVVIDGGIGSDNGDVKLATNQGKVITGEMELKLYSQDAEPTLAADNNMALWKDTNDSDRVYLIFRRGTADQVKIELV